LPVSPQRNLPLIKVGRVLQELRMRKRFAGPGHASNARATTCGRLLGQRFADTANIMIKSIRDVRKYVRQQRPAKPGEPITVRLHPDQLHQLKAWIAKQDDAPSRPEAMRRLLAKALGKK
jgi:uncharacterized short protein YbdD (DUF466 family)